MSVEIDKHYILPKNFKKLASEFLRFYNNKVSFFLPYVKVAMFYIFLNFQAYF